MINRDLDAEIVESIFKWRYIPVSSDYDGKNACQILFTLDREPTQDDYSCLPFTGVIHKGYFAPKYSDDILLAIKLAKHVELEMSIIDMPLDAEKLSKLCLDHYYLHKI